jgi:hypothetical protein
MNELVLIATRTTLPTTAIIAAAGERWVVSDDCARLPSRGQLQSERQQIRAEIEQSRRLIVKSRAGIADAHRHFADSFDRLADSKKLIERG